MQIIYQDSNFLALNKPSGVLVHPTTEKRKDEEVTLVDYILEKYPEVSSVGDNTDLRPGIVHRLDKDTSGIIIVARTQKFFNYFKNLLKENNITKTYLALVWGKVDKKGEIKKKIGLKPDTVKQTVWVQNAKMVKDAYTKYQRLEVFEKDGEEFSLVKLLPITGRTHQLRVHMASIHHSVVGDNMYGKTGNPWGINKQLLHARSIEFNLMNSGKRVKLEADLPRDFLKVLNSLGLTQNNINDILK